MWNLLRTSLGRTTVLMVGLLGLARASDRPNVLMISIDDLNDWVSCLDGHPQAKTPNLDKLASQGVLFANAHCQSPVCNPSRASLMTSLYPETTGIYFLSPTLNRVPDLADVTTLPERFENEGYEVAAAGKLFHSAEAKEYFKEWAGSMGGFGPMPKKKISQPHGHPLWDWGAFPEKDEMMPDVKLANWAVDRLAALDGEKPFLLAVGFYRPHVPMFVPKKWMDMHPREKIKLPLIVEDDLDDISPYAMDLTRAKHVAPTQEWMKESGEWDHAVQSYLASVTFVDDCVGKVLGALDKSPHRDNTIIVLFSDHGFHLGEKDRWAKRSLWEDGTRVPMVIVAPGMAKGRVTKKPVELIDLFPTLLDLVGAEPDATHEGQSLRPLLSQQVGEWPHLARTSFGPENVTLRSERYRYIRYADGSEEFYDHETDPHEWTNLAKDPKSREQMDALAKQLPKEFASVLGTRSTGHAAFKAAARHLKE